MMKKTRPADRANSHSQPGRLNHRKQVSAVALAAVLALGCLPGTASALALGRLTVQSALGEPLRAEIDFPDITAAEADSLKAAVASPDSFRAAGIDYSPALSNLQFSITRKPNGRAVLTITGSRPVNEPFVDLILEATWSSGRIVRDYTLLFDPPNLRTPAPARPAEQQLAAVPAAAPIAPSPAAPPAVVAPPPAMPAAAPAATTSRPPVTTAPSSPTPTLC